MQVHRRSSYRWGFNTISLIVGPKQTYRNIFLAPLILSLPTHVGLEIGLARLLETSLAEITTP